MLTLANALTTSATQVMASPFQGLPSWLLEHVKTPPRRSFLPVIASFETALISISIPLIFNMISRISERYQSPLLATKLRRLPSFLAVIFLAIGTIFFAVTGLFFTSDTPKSGVWYTFAWALFSMFFLSLIALGLLGKHVLDFSSNPDSLIQDVQHELEKLTNRKKAESRKKIQSRLEIFGDILVFEAGQRGSHALIETSLAWVENFWTQTDESGNNLAAATGKSKHARVEENGGATLIGGRRLDEDNRSALPASILQQISRINESAQEKGNTRIASATTLTIVKLLMNLCVSAENVRLVEMLLMHLIRINHEAIKRGNDSLASLSLEWYPEILVGRYQGKHRKCPPKILELVDRYFFAMVKDLVRQDRFPVFKRMIATLHHCYALPDKHGASVFGFSLIFQSANLKKGSDLLDSQPRWTEMERLEETRRRIWTVDAFTQWITDFEKMTHAYFEIGDELTIEKAQVEKEQIIEAAIESFRYRHLLSMLYGVGAFCLFHKRFQYIRELWEFQQPPDAVGAWGGGDLVPTDLSLILSSIFDGDRIETRFIDWEDHHGAAPYLLRYIVLVVARAMREKVQMEGRAMVGIDLMQRPEGPPYRLPEGNIHYYRFVAEEAPMLGHAARSLQLQDSVLDAVGLIDNGEGRSDRTNLFDRHVIPLFENVKLQAEQRIASLQTSEEPDPEAVEVFKEKFIETFGASAFFRYLFNEIGYLVDLQKEWLPYDAQETLPTPIRDVVDKILFYRGWFSNWDQLGAQYARQAADSEDTFLQWQIRANCKISSKATLEDHLDSMEDLSDVILVISPEAAWDLKRRQTDYHAEHRDIAFLGLGEPWNKGHFSHRDKTIPAYEMSLSGLGRCILILRSSKLGSLRIYAPQPPGDSGGWERGPFHIKIESYTANEGLMREQLTHPPHGENVPVASEELRAYLQRKALVEILWRIRYVPAPDFEGYVLQVKVEP